MTTETLLFIVSLAFLVLLSGFFSASETALFSISSIKIKSYKTAKDPRKRLIADLVLQPRDLLVTVFMLNTLVNILLQNVASGMVGEKASWLLKVGMPLLLCLIIGEIIPKYVGLQNNIALSYRVAPIIDFMQRLLQPLRKLIIAITTPISRLMFSFLKKEDEISIEELMHVLKASEEKGVLKAEEADLVYGYLNLQESIVKELMRPREDMLCYSIEEPLTKLTHLFADKQKSVIPVFEKELDNILGIITAKTFFLQHSHIKNPNDLIGVLTPPFYIPENALAKNLLRRLQEKKQVMAIVVDEYGSVSGLITRDDILDAVIDIGGENVDQSLQYTRSGENEIIASGRLELAEFNEIFDVTLESANNMVTLGGWLIEKMGDIPKSGTQFQTSDFLFQILAADPNRIRRLYVRKKKNPNFEA